MEDCGSPERPKSLYCRVLERLKALKSLKAREAEALEALALEALEALEACLALRPLGPEIRSQRRPWTSQTFPGSTLKKTSPAPSELRPPGLYKGPVLVPRRTPPGTWPLVGATVPLAVGRQASDLDRPAPSMSRGISAAHHRRWAAYAMSLGFRV